MSRVPESSGHKRMKTTQITELPANVLQSWLDAGHTLTTDLRGPKVLAMDDGSYVKIFHTRRHPLIARLFPAARRFHANACRLSALGIPVPEILNLYWIDRAAGLSACRYRPLSGETLENLLESDPAGLRQQLPAVAAFMRRLHKAGIYFRSLHLGNVVATPTGDYGLIDFLDMKIFSRPLNAWQVRRNFKHLDRYLKRRGLGKFPLDELMTQYFHPTSHG